MNLRSGAVFVFRPSPRGAVSRLLTVTDRYRIGCERASGHSYPNPFPTQQESAAPAVSVTALASRRRVGAGVGHIEIVAASIEDAVRRHGAGRLTGDERDRAWRPLLEAAIYREARVLSGLAAAVRSPLEEKFVLAFYAAARAAGAQNISLVTAGRRHLLTGAATATARPPPHGLVITTQAEVGSYRADFLLALNQWGGAASVVVEVDGHDFHEKTKAQAARDKKRDRAFVHAGLKVLRFTGSEVHRDPDATAREAWEQLDADVMGERRSA